MNARKLLVWLGVAAIGFFATSPALAYIHFPPMTMPKMCKHSSHIRVLSVSKHSKEKGVIVYDVVKTLKGQSAADMTLLHAIRIDAEGVKPILDWMDDKKQAVLFTIEAGGLACGYVFIDEYCYSVDYNQPGKVWNLIRAEPAMAGCYHGPAGKLSALVAEILAGRDVTVPVQGADPSKEEVDKRARQVTDKLEVNRGIKQAVAAAATDGLTADDVTKLIQRLVELDSIDVAKEVKFRAGLEPSLHAFDADEAAMKVLENPYEAHGKDKPGAAGWYRVSFTVPEQIGKFAMPKNGYNLGVESNVLGTWEIYTYNNGKPAGAAMATGVPGVWNQGNMLWNTRQPATAWMSNAPLPCKPGDKITLAILATATPLGRGSPDGLGLRHLRLRFALAHTGARQPFYGNVPAPGTPGTGSGLHGAREMLATLKGDELKALQDKLKGPLSRMDAVFAAAETGQLDNLTKAMRTAATEINEALKKK